ETWGVAGERGAAQDPGRSRVGHGGPARHDHAGHQAGLRPGGPAGLHHRRDDQARPVDGGPVVAVTGPRPSPAPAGAPAMVPSAGEARYPRFSSAEFARRFDAARAMMAREGVDILAVYGTSAIARHNQADVHYLSGFLGNRNNYVLLPPRGDPILFAQSHNHVPNAREVAGIETRWGGVSSARTVAQVVRASRGPGTLGYVGPVPIHDYLAWQGELPGWEFKDITGPFRHLRLRKSAEELEWLRRGAALTDAAIIYLIDNVTPGMREYELEALVQEAVLRGGGLPHLAYISSTPQDASDVCVPRQNLS